MLSQDSVTVDFLVVGTGAGALTGAIRAHDLGLNTLVVERRAAFMAAHPPCRAVASGFPTIT